MRKDREDFHRILPWIWIANSGGCSSDTHPPSISSASLCWDGRDVSRPVGGWTLDASAGIWLFSTNDSYYPAHALKRQEPVVALQGHASYALPRRSWLAFNATWFAGGETRVDGVLNPDLQRNTRAGATLSIPIVGQQSVKLSYSTGTSTRRGSDFNTFNVTWQIVTF